MSTLNTWYVYHDDTCESFKNSWLDCEKEIIEKWYKTVSERFDITITRSPEGIYSIADQDAQIFDVTILHREDDYDVQNKQ
jgi:hypothetical protein